MAVPARKQQVRPRQDRRPNLRVVEGSKTSRKSATSVAVMRMRLFLVITCTVLLVVFGLGRIYLSSMATSAAAESVEINSKLRDAKADSDRLELKQSVLSNPETIRTYAQTNLQMAPPQSVSYVDISNEVKNTVAEVPATEFESGAPVKASMGGTLDFVRNIFAPHKTGAGVVSKP